MRWRSVRAQRSVGSGVRAGRLLSPEIGRVRGADAVGNDGRQHRGRRFREPSTDPAGSENPLHVRDLFMPRTGRAHDHPLVVMGGRALPLLPLMVPAEETPSPQLITAE